MDQNNKIGIFTDDFFPFRGGMGRHIFEITGRLDSQRVVIFSSNINAVKNHVSIYPFVQKLGKNILLSFLLHFRLSSLIKKYNLNIVHLHCGPGGLILLIKPKEKLICTVHHTYYQQQKYVAGQKWKYIFYLLEKITFQHADEIIAVSEDTKEVLINDYHIAPRKITVIPNGVDTSKFYVQKNIKKIPHSLIYVGRLEARKGVDFLIQSMPQVKLKIPNVQLFIVGKGKLKVELEAYILQNDLANNIHIVDSITDGELVTIYNQCQLAIVPSIFEGFGISVIEAIACGLPVIGTNSDGIRSLVKLFPNSTTVDYGDAPGLARAIVKQLESSFSFSSQNQSIIKKRFSWDAIAQQTQKIYDNA